MARIDELLKMEEYNIYFYTNLNLERLSELAKYLSEENIDLSNYFSLNKFSTKFCRSNVVFTIKKMEYPQKLRGLTYLFALLKDINWPVFDEAEAVIMSFDKKDIIPFMEECLHQAYWGKDGMWIFALRQATQDMRLLSCILSAIVLAEQKIKGEQYGQVWIRIKTTGRKDCG